MISGSSMQATMRTSPHRPDMSRYQSQIPVSAVASSSSKRAARLGLLFRERWLTYPTPPTRHHSGPVTAVRGKHPVKPRQVGTWWRQQCSQFTDKVQWLKDLVRGDVTARRLKLIPNITVRVSDRRFPQRLDELYIYKTLKLLSFTRTRGHTRL